MPSAPLFDEPSVLSLDEGAVVLRGLALPLADELVDAVGRIAAQAPFRHWSTPGGQRMSVAMTNTGALGWVSDRRGYRYEPCDPIGGSPWPPLPSSFRRLAVEAAAQAGHTAFEPDACLVNRYEPGTRLSLHQDRDEADARHPIVSASLGLPAVFLWGGAARSVRPRRVLLEHGDVVVWGGPSRLHFHGVAPLEEGVHARCGRCRINLTFRRAR